MAMAKAEKKKKGKKKKKLSAKKETAALLTSTVLNPAGEPVNIDLLEEEAFRELGRETAISDVSNLDMIEKTLLSLIYEDDQQADIALYLSVLHVSELAQVLNRLKFDEQRHVIAALGKDLDPEILAWVDPDTREKLIEQLGISATAEALAELDSDDAVAILEDLDDADQQDILSSVPNVNRVVLEQGLSFPEYSAGRLMQRELVAVPEHWTVGQIIDYLRLQDDLPDDFYDLFVIDPTYTPIGSVSLSRILRHKRPVRVAEIMTTQQQMIPAEMDQEEVALKFRKYGLVSAPVVDQNGRLLGVITVDDVVEVIDEEAEEDLMRLAGVGDTNIYRAVWATAKTRATWLSVNLATAILASVVIGVFEQTIAQIVALAVLMPIVASMGGNAGTQTLTVAVRALAMKELTPKTGWRLIGRETLIGLLNGLLFSVIIGGCTFLWQGNTDLSFVIASAMIINLVIAGLTGAAIPIFLQKVGIDPAIASAVFLTTITDIIGFFAFLGLAAILLLP